MTDHDHDKRGSLKKVSATFDRLAGLKGAFGAIEAMVAVLFG